MIFLRQTSATRYLARWWDSDETSPETRGELEGKLAPKALQELLDATERRARDPTTVAKARLGDGASPVVASMAAQIGREIAGLESRGKDAAWLLAEVIARLNKAGPKMRTIEEATATGEDLAYVKRAQLYEMPVVFRSLFTDGRSHVMTRPAVQCDNGVVARKVTATLFSLEAAVDLFGTRNTVADECCSFGQVHSAVMAPLALQVAPNPPDTDAHKAIVRAGLPVEPLPTDLAWGHKTPPQSAALKHFLATGRQDLFMIVTERLVGQLRVYGVIRQRLAPAPTARHHHLVDGIVVYGEFGYAPACCFRVVGAPQANWHERYHAPPGSEHPLPLVGQLNLSWRVWHVVNSSGYMMDT